MERSTREKKLKVEIRTQKALLLMTLKFKVIKSDKNMDHAKHHVLSVH